MLNNEVIKDISFKIRAIVEASPISDLEKNIDALLRTVFTKFDLVTREEFDVQAEVLRNTREKLVELEVKLSKLENMH
jgi:BMFP domain-containing protein YqiC